MESETAIEKVECVQNRKIIDIGVEKLFNKSELLL